MLGQHVIILCSQLNPVHLLTQVSFVSYHNAAFPHALCYSSRQRSHTHRNALQVQLSNHTGYPSWTGSVMDGQQLAELLKGLQANGLTSCSHLLTGKQVPHCCGPQVEPACPLHCLPKLSLCSAGYIGSVSLLKGIAEVLTELRKTNPSLTYGEARGQPAHPQLFWVGCP